jgi:hypothetical protein
MVNLASLSTYQGRQSAKEKDRQECLSYCPYVLFSSGPASMSPVLPKVAKVTTPIATIHS